MSSSENNPYNNPYNAKNPAGNVPQPPPAPVPPVVPENSPYAQTSYSQPQGAQVPGPAQYENSPYAQSPYAQSPYAQGTAPGVATADGQKKKTLGIVFGIISLFLFPLIFGPLAIYNGRQANALGANGKPGIVLGIIGLVLFVFSILFYFSNR